MSGQSSAKNAAEVQKFFDGAVPVIDGGECPIGTASTIVEVRGDVITILRKGAIDKEEIFSS